MYNVRMYYWSCMLPLVLHKFNTLRPGDVVKTVSVKSQSKHFFLKKPHVKMSATTLLEYKCVEVQTIDQNLSATFEDKQDVTVTLTKRKASKFVYIYTYIYAWSDETFPFISF